MTSRVWFKKAVGFSCTQCGRCCKGKTNVFVNNSEINAISDFLKIPLVNFKQIYMSNESTIKNDPSKSHCIFLKNNKCSIYDVRPTQVFILLLCMYIL